jgi:hypothetical protein
MSESKKPMPIILKAVLIYISSAVLAFIFSGLIGKLYRYIEGPYLGRSIGVLSDAKIDTFLGGFVWTYLFFVGLLSGLFVNKKLWLVWLIGFIILGLLSLWSLKIFVVSLAFSLFGLILAKLILLLKNKLKN